MSLVADFQVNGLNPSNVGGTGTAIKYFPRILGPSIGVAPSTPSASNAAGQLLIPGQNILQGQSIRVKLAGNVLPFTGGTTFQIALQANTGSVASPTYVTLAQTAAITLAQATRSNWAMEVVLTGDGVSGQVGGWFSAMANNANVLSSVALTTPLTGINFNTGVNSPVGSDYPFGLVVGVTFATSLAQNAASLYQFQVYAI